MTELRKKDEQVASDAFVNVLRTLAGTAVKKNSKVNYGNTKFSYPDLSAVLAHITPILDENGFVLYSYSTSDEVTTVAFHVETGVKFETSLPLSFAKGSDPQALGSAITYFRRYNLYNLFNLQVTDDDGKGAQDSIKGAAAKTVGPAKESGNLEEMFGAA